MGEIAEMMLDGTMDWETGEWNFDGDVCALVVALMKGVAS